MEAQYEALLALIRLGIGHSNTYTPKRIEWGILKQLAREQGLSAVVLDGVERLPDNFRPTNEGLFKWLGEVLQSYEHRYISYAMAISSLALFHNEHGYKMMLLKGYACALDWPKPEHRPCGDIDIWQFGRQKEVDDVIHNKLGIEINNSHHHHTVFNWDGFTVENHYNFINTHAHKSSKVLEKLFKEMGKNDTYTIEVKGERVYVPSPNMNALFLLRHSMAHFAAQGINLRQLLDWAFFAEKHHEEIDWAWLEVVLTQFGMKDLYNVFNAICVYDLGFDINIFHEVQFDPNLKDRVLKEILEPAIPNNKPKSAVKRMVWKYRRWKANEWKHKLCYKESMWSAFWSGVWGHLLKPSSI